MGDQVVGREGAGWTWTKNLSFCEKKNGGVGLGVGQIGCERRIEVFVKIQKTIFGGRGGGLEGRVGGGGSGSGWMCEQRIEVFVKY